MQERSFNILQGKSVLLVNFSTKKNNNTLQYISDYEFNSNFAESLQQCHNYLTAKQYDLVICHYQSNNDEYISQLISHIRSNDKLFKLPIVVISDIIAPNFLSQLIGLGITEYLVPPIIPSLIEERLINAIEFPIRNQKQNLPKSAITHRFKNVIRLEDIQILIVDDVPSNIEIIADTLKGQFKVKAANNANSAMKICLTNNPPDIILLDIMMPNVDGLTFCKQIKSNPLTQDIRVIFTTALASVKDVVRGLKLGAVDYITKPIIPKILEARVKTHGQLILQSRILQQQIDLLINQSNELQS